MRDVVYDFLQIARHNKDGSYLTQAQRHAMLSQIGNQLVDLGWKSMRAHDFRGRHVNALLKLWHTQGLTDATIKNRLSILRWLCEKLNRPSVMPKTNAPYQLAPRLQAAVVSKAVSLSEDILRHVEDAYVQMSFRLQQTWGLRREESIKIRVWEADQGDHLALRGSWCKGGRERTIPLVWPEQRDVLDRAKVLVRFKSASLIPRDLQYHQQRNKYTEWARKLDLDPMHGLRHKYAQRRFEMLSGFPCPLAGGPHRAELTPDQREADRAARQQVSRELGHNRPAITGMYVGL